MKATIEAIDASTGHIVKASSPTRRAAAPRASSSSSDSSGRRGRRGERGPELLALIQSKPGMRVTDYAKEMDLKPNYIYRLKKEASDRGQITIRDNRLYPAEQTAEAPQEPPVAA